MAINAESSVAIDKRFTVRQPGRALRQEHCRKSCRIGRQVQRFRRVRGRGHLRMESQNAAAPKQIPTSKFHHPIEVGRHVSCGFRKSIPDSKYHICAGVIVTIPSAGEGHRNRPRSSRRT